MKFTEYGLIIEKGVPALEVKAETDVEVDFSSVLNPKHVFILAEKIRLNIRAEEFIYILGFNVKEKPLGIFEVSHGTLCKSICTPREIMIRLLLCGSNSFLIVHNHPSGDVRPSKMDIDYTNEMKKAGDLLAIHLLDHVIVGPESEYFSFFENELLK